MYYFFALVIYSEESTYLTAEALPMLYVECDAEHVNKTRHTIHRLFHVQVINLKCSLAWLERSIVFSGESRRMLLVHRQFYFH